MLGANRFTPFRMLSVVRLQGQRVPPQQGKVSLIAPAKQLIKL